MVELVSIIIPCFNAERWIAEAIESCLQQTYTSIEIIVIDDGSTDHSLEIIKSFDKKIIWETGPNRGGNYARNRGFSLSQGQFIQYLDADDYLKPDKIQRQVNFLKVTGMDVVYGDWRHQYHEAGNEAILGDIKVSGGQSNLLATLLSGWWVSPACILFRRRTVAQSGGWDETLTAGQDKDFFLAVVFKGSKVGYQPGCDSIYRRYGKVTVSTASKERYLTNHIKILEKYEGLLSQAGKLSSEYKDAIAQSFFMIARSYFYTDRTRYKQYLEKALSLSPNFSPKGSERTVTYNILSKVLGFRTTERITLFLKSATQKMTYI